MSLQLLPARELFIDPELFVLESGQILPGLEIVYELHGPAGAPLLAILGGISASSHPCGHPGDPESGWWQGIVGPALAADTERYRILGIEFLAGPGCPMRLAGDGTVSQVTPRDQARILARLLRGLDLAPLHAFLGASYGGMVGLCLAEEEPALLRRLCVVAAAHRPDAWAQALRSLQRRVLRLGRGTEQELDCVSIARGLAMLSYRSRREFQGRFETRARLNGSRPCFESEAYLESRGGAFAETFDSESYHALSQAIDLQDVNPARVDVSTFLISVESDLITPPDLVEELHRALPHPLGHVSIDSLYGHDAFLKETAVLGPLLQGFLEGRES